MFKRIIFSTIAMAMICAVPIGLAHADDQTAAVEQVKQAKLAADAWLKLVDDGNYKESWNQLATVVKPLVSEDKWAQEAAAGRKLMGPVISRNFKAAKYSTTLPGAPDGHYVVIQYDSSFANKKSTVEEVVPMLDTDGKWRVSGYHFVK
jgi:hypothetical protein